MLLNAVHDQETESQAQEKNDSMDKSMALSLANIRGSLIRQEDTIIFSLIERSQFSLNAPVYDGGELPSSPAMGGKLHCATFAAIRFTASELRAALQLSNNVF